MNNGIRALGNSRLQRQACRNNITDSHRRFHSSGPISKHEVDCGVNVVLSCQANRPEVLANALQCDPAWHRIRTVSKGDRTIPHRFASVEIRLRIVVNPAIIRISAQHSIGAILGNVIWHVSSSLL